MGLKDQLSSITASIAGDPAPAATRHPRTAPGQLFAFSAQTQQLQAEIDGLKKRAGEPRMLDLTSLKPSPYQTRAISTGKVEELAENLRHNELASPIVVREIDSSVDGRRLFETIAGHRRTLAFAFLGRTEIPAIVVQMTDEQAERAVFFDNFFPPEIADYEKYLGLSQLRRRHGYTHDALAERSGISRQMIGYLLAFEKLPDSAHAILQAHPTLIGAALAGKLAALPVTAKSKITEGLDLVAQGTLTAAKLMNWLMGKDEPPQRTEQTTIKAGKSVFAKVQRRSTRVTIDFADAADAEVLEREIPAFLSSLRLRYEPEHR